MHKYVKALLVYAIKSTMAISPLPLQALNKRNRPLNDCIAALAVWPAVVDFVVIARPLDHRKTLWVLQFGKLTVYRRSNPSCRASKGMAYALPCRRPRSCPFRVRCRW